MSRRGKHRLTNVVLKGTLCSQAGDDDVNALFLKCLCSHYHVLDECVYLWFIAAEKEVKGKPSVNFDS
jgi:hypothetical protein